MPTKGLGISNPTLTFGGLIRTALSLVMYFGLSVLLGFGAGYFATAVLPCQWFGSNFEGACGYGALWAAIGIGVVVATVSFSYFSFRVVRAMPLTQEGASLLKGPLVWVWGASLLAVLAASILPIAHLGNMVDIPASFLALGFFISASMVLARRLQMTVWLAFLALVPFVGTLFVAALISREILARKKAGV